MIWQIFFVFGSTILIPTHALTTVGGVLIQNTIWTATGSENPYTLTADVQIPFNSTLTIQQGVIVDFSQGDFEILVKGFLQIQGTSGQPVVFRNGSATNQKWMIKFQSTQLSQSSILNAHFIGPKKAIQIMNVPLGIQENNGTLVTESSIFSDNTGVGANGVYPRTIYLSVPALEFRSCTFNQTSISSIDANSEPITINNSQIYNTTIYPRASNQGIQIDNSVLTNILVYFDLQYVVNVFRLNNSQVTGWSFTAPYSWYYISFRFIVGKSIVQNFVSYNTFNIVWYQQTNFTFEDSSMNNVVLMGLSSTYYDTRQSFSLIIRNCNYTSGILDLTNIITGSLLLIENSELQNVYIVAAVAYSDSYYAYRQLVMRNATFVDGVINVPSRQADISYSTITLVSPPLSVNGASRITCSSISRSTSILQGDTLGVNATDLQLYSSTIKNFAIGLRVSPTSLYTVNTSGTNFIGNSRYNIDNKGVYNVYAAGDYWGTNNEGTIIRKISDYWEDINYGFVIVSNYSSNLLAAETGCPSYTG